MRKGVSFGLVFVLVLLAFFVLSSANTSAAGSVLQQKKNITNVSVENTSFYRAIEPLARKIFAISPNENFDFSYLMVLISLFILVFSILASIIQFVPFIGKGFTSHISAFIICLIASMTGGIKSGAVMFMGAAMGNVSNTTKIVFVMVSIIAALLVYLSADKLLKKFAIDKAHTLGERLGFNQKLEEKKRKEESKRNAYYHG